jgi:hypothetical protein
MKSPSSSARSAAVPASHKPASPVTFLSVCFIPLQVPDVSGSYPFNTWRENDLHTTAHLRIPGFRTLSAMAIVAAFLLSTPARAAAQEYSELVVFGDSLSDSGNAFALRGAASTPPDYALDPFLIPGAPYARGGHHFQDGASWVEQLARSLGVSGSAGPAFRSPGAVARNFAVGGGRERGGAPALVAALEARMGRHRGWRCCGDGWIGLGGSP